MPASLTVRFTFQPVEIIRSMTTFPALAGAKCADLENFGRNGAGFILFNLATDMYVLINESGRACWVSKSRFQQLMAPSQDPVTETACAASNAVPRTRAEQDAILAEFAESAVTKVLELIGHEQREGRLIGRDFTIAAETRRRDGALWLQLSTHPAGTEGAPKG